AATVSVNSTCRASQLDFGSRLRVEHADNILRHEAAEQFLARRNVEFARLAADLGASLEHRKLERPEMLPCDWRQPIRRYRDEILNLPEAPPRRIGRGLFTAGRKHGRKRAGREQRKHDRGAGRG